MSLTYRDAGVDIDAGNALVAKIGPLAAATRRPGVLSGLGGFGGLFGLREAGYQDPVLVSGTDGVGTKLKLAFATGRHDTIGIDLVAMCANDVVTLGAEPLFFLDYFGTGRLETGVAAEVVAGIAEGCKRAGCALLGGETAELPGMYADGEYDLAGFVVGAVERDAMIDPSRVRSGDVVLGLASSGLHSNGYSLARMALLERGRQALEGALADALLEPTKMYVKPVLAALAEHGLAIHGLAHITGGGLLENVPRAIPDHLVADIDYQAWPRPELFGSIAAAGVEEAEMRRTFNLGIGMAVVVDAASAEAVSQTFEAAGETVFSIGTVRAVEPGNDAVAIGSAKR